MRHYIGTRVFAYSSSESTITAVPVNIGNANVKKYVNHDYKHLVGKDYPLYGIKTRVPKNKNPKFNRMSQLAALVALEIVNEGDGKANGEANIEIRNVSYEVKNENIVGGFKVDITGDEPSFANGTSPANKTTVTIVDDNDKDSFISIAPGDSAKIYFAVKPHDASGKSVTITVNGSSRTITMPANTKFKMGQATTIRVPVKLSYPKDSDAIGNSNFTLTMPEGTKVTSPLKVNGESIEKAWVVGDGISQTLTIHGYARDMIKALDVGFYASTLKGKNAAMTISKINIYLPDGDKENEIGSYTPLLDVIGTELEDDIRTVLFGKDLGPDHITIGLAKVAIAVTVSGGIPRDDTGALCFLYLTKFINPQTITFNGLISNGATNITDDILILDEAPIYKEIKAEVINRFLGERFADYAGNKPTCEGLQDIVNGKTDTNAAEITSQTLYNVLETVFREKGTMSMNVLSKDVDINLHNVFKGILPNVDALIDMLQTMRLNLEITTCPYHANKETGYGTKLAPIPLDKIAGEKYPIIFWGLDAYGPDKSAPTPVAD